MVKYILNSKTEMRLYELLGVRIFQKLVFRLEKAIHCRDKGKNINYHIPSNDISALDAFVKYLFYNGAIHTRNLILFSGYLFIKVLFSLHFRFYDYVLFILAIKDLYCVILQRYNLLRMQRCKELLSARIARKKEAQILKIQEQFQTNYDYSYAESDLAVIKRIKACLTNHETIILSDADISTLNRLLSINDQHIM